MNRLGISLRLTCGLFLGTVLGCGLADYEDKMKQSQKKLERFDEEVRALDEPIQLPKKKVKDKDKGEREEPIALIFLRPPRGIQPKASKPEGDLYRFPRAPQPGQQPAPTPGATPSASSPFLDVCVVWKSDKEDPDNFARSILQRFPSKDGKPLSTPPDREIPSPDENRRTVKVYEYFEPTGSYCTIAIRSKGKLRVAVIYQVEKGKKTKQTDDVTRYSIDSLAIDDEVDLAEKLQARLGPRLQAPPPPSQPPAP